MLSISAGLAPAFFLSLAKNEAAFGSGFLGSGSEDAAVVGSSYGGGSSSAGWF